MDIYTILKDLYRTRNLQQWVNNRFYSETDFIIKRNEHVIEVNGIKFYLDDMFNTIDSVNTEYNFDDIQPSDIVLDIGACIGGFSLRVAPLVKHVYAVEPIMTDRLRENIKLNNIKNITVIEGALGNGSIVDINWMRTIRRHKTKSLSDLNSLCGSHIDFLKCDCEGAEWCIKPEELKGIRRIEAEIHSFKNMPSVRSFLPILDNAGFNYTITDLNNYVAIITHAKNKNIS